MNDITCVIAIIFAHLPFIFTLVVIILVELIKQNSCQVFFLCEFQACKGVAKMDKLSIRVIIIHSSNLLILYCVIRKFGRIGVELIRNRMQNMN